MICNFEHNRKSFGDYLRRLRKKSGLTQTSVIELAGVNHETLRKIEYGEVTPKIDTINKLSKVYNVDVLKAFSNCKYPKERVIQLILDEIDRVSVLDKIDELDHSCLLLNDFIKDNKNELDEEIFIKIQQINSLIQVIRIKNKTDKMNVTQAEIFALEGIRLRHPSFEYNKMSNTIFTIIELRLLISLAFSRSRLDKDEQSIQILKGVIENLQYHIEYNINVMTYLIQTYYMLSYVYYINAFYTLSVSMCDKGIHYSNKIYNSKLLPHLYFRRAVSKKALNLKDYHDDFDLSISAVKLQGDLQLLETFKENISKFHD